MAGALFFLSFGRRIGTIVPIQEILMDFLSGFPYFHRIFLIGVPAKPIAFFLEIDIGHPFSGPLIVGHAGTAAGVGASQLLIPFQKSH